MPALTDLAWPVVTERLGLAPPDRSAWDDAFAEPDRLAKTVVIELDGEVIGDLMVAVGDDWGQRERLMERVGMRREQHGLRDSLHRERGWLDGYTYALLAEEWTS